MDNYQIAVGENIGQTAGEVWRLLDEGGPQTLLQLKKKLNGGPEYLEFAVGWLAREDKLEILRDKKSTVVRLK